MPLIPGGGRKRRRGPPTPGGEKAVLSQSDFTYEGFYLFPDVVVDHVEGRGVAHRYVDDTLQIITMHLNQLDGGNKQTAVIWALPGSYGQNASLVNYGGNFWNGGFGLTDPWQSLWYDDQNDRLWVAASMDYPWDVASRSNTAVLTGRTLPANGGTCTNYTGWKGFQGIGSRAAFGKPQRVPSWFRTKHSLPEYVSLSGGYSSLMEQGLGASIGPMFFFFEEPWAATSLTFGTDSYSIPTAERTIKADFRSGSNSLDWYSGNPDLTTFENRPRDRAARVTPIKNYMDVGSDPRPDAGNNPSTPPTEDPLPGGNWYSPCPLDPQGYGRWSWVDSFHGSGTWIDGANKHGIMMIGTVTSGSIYYQSSGVQNTNRAAELHIYNPEDVATNSVAYRLRPSSLFTLPDLTQYCTQTVKHDATFDAATGKLYVMQYGARHNTVYKNMLHVYQVAA